MDDNLMFDYLLQMGAMRPEQDEMKRKQAMVDALRGNAMDPMRGQMVGNVYVGGGLGGALSKLGQAYFAKQGQQGVDAGLAGLNTRQSDALLDLRMRQDKKRRQDMLAQRVPYMGEEGE